MGGDRQAAARPIGERRQEPCLLRDEEEAEERYEKDPTARSDVLCLIGRLVR